MIFYLSRKLYVYMMLRAIKKACYDVVTERIEPRTYGLRAIKTFEKVNQCKFNPFDSLHVHHIEGMAWYQRSFRMIYFGLKDCKQKEK